MNCRASALAALLAAMAWAMPASAQTVVNPAIVYGTGGKADRSFNASASRGVARFRQSTQIVVAEFEPADEAQFEPGLRRFALAGHDPIVALGFPQAAALEKVAKELTTSRFTIIDATVALPNIRSILFKEHESAFLAGIVAALASTSGKVGFVGGMESPLMRRFLCGYQQGIRHTDSKVMLIADMAGTTLAAWNDPGRGAQLARAQFDRGVDVVFAAGGTTGVGVLQAAKERGKLAIASSDKDFSAPDTVLTSTVKRVDVATFQAFAMALQGTWRSGRSMLGLKEGAVDWVPEGRETKLISPAMRKQVEAAKAQIIAGKIAVHDYTSTNACTPSAGK